MNRMRAVVYKAAGTVAIDEVPVAELPPGGLLVRTSFVGVCGSDVRTWRHGNKRLSGEQTLGHEVTGVIVESDAVGLVPGTRVAVCPGVPCLACEDCQRARHNLCRNRRVLAYDFPGGMAEAFAVPAAAVRAGCVVAIPNGLPSAHATLAEPLHTVLNGQDRAGVHAGESVLVLGLGPVGTLHCAVAMSRGARLVLGMDPAAGRVAAAADVLGADRVARLDEQPGARLRERGGPRGWDAVIVATAAHPAFALALEVVAPRGRVLAFSGLPAGKTAVTIDMGRLHYEEIRLIGAFGGTPRYFREAVDWLAGTDLDLDRIVGGILPLDHALEAFGRVERGVGLKTLLRAGAPDDELAAKGG